VSSTEGASAESGAAPEGEQPSASRASREHLRRRREIRPKDLLLAVRGLKVYFPIKAGILIDRQVGNVKAVDGVDLDVPRGSTVGLVGESGCGKTTLGRAILRLVEPTGGTVRFDGIDVAALEGEELRRMRRRMQMIFQDPMASLDPRQSVESVLTEPRRAHSIERGRAKGVGELLELVGLPGSAASRYPHEFSGGQRKRIGIARAIALEPDLIIADEPVSALDVSIQAQVINLLEELQDRLGLTYVVIAHDLAVVRHIADVVAVMYLGSIAEQAPSDALYKTPYHPYTKALMSAVPIPDPVVEDTRERILLTGDLPSSANPPLGCRFHTRCPYRQPTRCDDERPPLREIAPGHRVACHWAEDIDAGVITPRASAVVEAALPEEAPPEAVPLPGDRSTTTLGPPPGV
jgi:peptide/nickel transport system ATP-binding protein